MATADPLVVIDHIGSTLLAYYPILKDGDTGLIGCHGVVFERHHIGTAGGRGYAPVRRGETIAADIAGLGTAHIEHTIGAALYEVGSTVDMASRIGDGHIVLGEDIAALIIYVIHTCPVGVIEYIAIRVCALPWVGIDIDSGVLEYLYIGAVVYIYTEGGIADSIGRDIRRRGIEPIEEYSDAAYCAAVSIVILAHTYGPYVIVIDIYRSFL